MNRNFTSRIGQGMPIIMNLLSSIIEINVQNKFNLKIFLFSCLIMSAGVRKQNFISTETF